MHLTLSLLCLLALLATAVRRPRGLPEVVIAAPAVALLITVGAVSYSAARSEVRHLGPVVGFLAAVLVLAAGCEGEGVFRAAGVMLARASRRSASSLLLAVAGIAAATTALLSLDTTVVLLTPVVVATVRANGARPRPHLYVTAHLANSASLLLPVSNLTNLLAFAVLPISFTRFTALLVLPWLAAIAIETGAVSTVFRRDLSERLTTGSDGTVRLPVFATTVVLVTVVGFAIASFAGIAPAWVAAAGAAILALRRLIARRTTVVEVVRSASPSFCLFVFGLGIVVGAVSADGLGRVVRHLIPSGTGLLPLLGTAAVAALLANLMNNLPATLLLIPIAAVGGVGPALAVLIGTDIGPNLTYPGSLATLLWRRAVREVDGVPELAEFTRLGALTVPCAIVVSTAALWLSLRVIGTS